MSAAGTPFIYAAECSLATNGSMSVADTPRD